MKSLVIDASIAKGAGGIEKIKPGCKPCRDFLLAVLNSGHRFTSTDAINEEWKNHAASFARRWKVQMIGRKRMDHRAGSPTLGLRERVLSALTKTKDREAAAKDCHLLYAALDSDRIIASLDDTVRRLFANAAPVAAELSSILWVNPDRPEESAHQWVRDGALPHPSRTLSQFPSH